MTDEETGSDGPSDLLKITQKANGRARVCTCFLCECKAHSLTAICQDGGVNESKNRKKRELRAEQAPGEARGLGFEPTVKCLLWRMEGHWTDSRILPSHTHFNGKYSSQLPVTRPSWAVNSLKAAPPDSSQTHSPPPRHCQTAM